MEELDGLKAEMTELMKNKDRETANADLSHADEASAINRKLATLRRNRSRLSSQLEALHINVDAHTSVTPGDIQDLAHYFPTVNTGELEMIEGFHRKLHKVLETEISEETEELQSSISVIDSEINELQEQLRSIGIPTHLPTPFLEKHASLSMKIRDLEAQIQSFNANSEVKDEYTKARNLLKEAQQKELPRIAGQLHGLSISS